MIMEKLNIIVAVVIALCFSKISLASGKPKYAIGDCITPINKNYSWFGEIARIEAFSSIEGFPDKSYILWFPTFHSNSVIFSKSIEKHTKKVSRELCFK